MIPSQRHRFDIPREVAYFNCGYMSPLLLAAQRAGEQGLARKCRPWEVRAEDFFSLPQAAREAFARVAGCQPDSVALIPAVSYGMGIAARNLPLGPGQQVILLEEGFPSTVYPWRERAREVGAEVVLVPRPGDDDWTSTVLEAIGPDTAVAALPQLHWTDGGLLDLAAIAGRLREVGATLAVDATQSLGVMPFDLYAIQPDFLVAAAYKWLLGPYSVGFLYVAPRWHQGTPLEYNWIAREGSQDFGGLVRYRDGYQPGARRYDVGEPPNWALLPAAIAGLTQIADWGIPAIYRTLTGMTTRIAEASLSLGLRAVPAHRRAGHYLGLRAVGALPDGLLDRLAGDRVYISRRGSALRVTPHLYNDEEDLTRLLEALSAGLTA